MRCYSLCMSEWLLCHQYVENPWFYFDLLQFPDFIKSNTKIATYLENEPIYNPQFCL